MNPLQINYSSSGSEEELLENRFISMTPKMFNVLQRNKSREIKQEVMTETLTSQKLIQKQQLITPGSEIFIKTNDTDILGIPKSEFNFKAVGNSQVCTIPKKCIHTYEGHKKGVNCCRFIPNSGHIFASASNDCTIKIWEVYKKKQCLATIAAHNKGIRDLNWGHTGNKLISASFDKYVKIFDIKKEKPIFNWTIEKIPYVVKFHPNKEHLFLVGCGDKNVYQVDVRANEIVQTYSEHKGPINSISFLEDGNRFVSTANDNTMRVFELDIPTAIAFKSEPTSNSISSTCIHPDNNWILCQSFSNTIVCFGAQDQFRVSKKRQFKGHDIASYGCTVNTSPDGKFVLSGDALGRLFFWNWKNFKVIQQFKNHKDVVMDCGWSPQESSKVITASWDKTLKLWE